MIKRALATAPVLALTVAGGAFLAPSAVAAEATSCVVNLDTQRSACAASEAAATRAVAGADSLTIARIYDPTGYSGASLAFVQSRECTPSYDVELQWDNLGELGWNNRMSSVHTYHRCDVKLYDGYNFTGAVSVWIDQASNLGTIGTGWSNRASSIKFS